MADIFVSYRRDDSQHAAGRLNDRIEAAFGAGRVFFDTVAIQPGEDFVDVLGAKVGACRILIAVIGPRWLEILEGRLGEANDFVRIEIAEAMRRGVRVVPVVIDGAKLPPESRLPEELKPLVRRHAVPVRADTFRSDVDQLVAFMRQYLDGPTGPAQTENRIQIAAPLVHGAPKDENGAGCFLPGNGGHEWFKDHDDGPEMVVVPAGEFVMGSPTDDAERIGSNHPHAHAVGAEEPLHLVRIDRAFAVARLALTVDEFSVFAQAARRNLPDELFTFEHGRWEVRRGRSWLRPGFAQNGRHPVVGVSWEDAQAYCAWLSQISGRPYRLLSEAEWEYVARAGTTTPFPWGRQITPALANYNGEKLYAGGGAKGIYRKSTVPVDYAGEEFRASPWGLQQMLGNVWEWTADTFHPSYVGAPSNGAAWTLGGSPSRIVRGGSWNSSPRTLRSARRHTLDQRHRNSAVGIRVARDLVY